MVAIAGAGAGAGVDCGISNSNHRHTSTATASRFSHARTFVLFSAVCCHVQNNRAITNKNSAKPLFERPVSSNNTTLVCSCASPQPPLRAPLRCAALLLFKASASAAQAHRAVSSSHILTGILLFISWPSLTCTFPLT